jgi:hypothetical protein
VSEGKAAYVAANNGFLRAVQTAEKKEMLTDADMACVWMNYKLASPAGRQTALDAVEIWTAADGQLATLTIHFDTAAFAAFMQQG